MLSILFNVDSLRVSLERGSEKGSSLLVSPYLSLCLLTLNLFLSFSSKFSFSSYYDNESVILIVSKSGFE
jgi:hypothetical protein